jgi:hypothetical protein
MRRFSHDEFQFARDSCVHLNIQYGVKLIVSVENKSIDKTEHPKSSTKYCVECGAKMSTAQLCHACGETQR